MTDGQREAYAIENAHRMVGLVIVLVLALVAGAVVLRQQEIGEDRPGALLRDFDALLQFIGPDGLPATWDAAAQANRAVEPRRPERCRCGCRRWSERIPL